MEEIERSAASVEEAVDAALDELGLSEQEALIEIVQEPRSGFLGLNSQPAVVRVRRRDQPLAIEEDAGEQADVALSFVDGLLSAMGIDAGTESVVVDGTTYIDVWAEGDSDDMALLIGKHGHTLDALQELLRGHIQRSTEERCLVQVDVEDYRKRRSSRVAQRAADAARRVQKSGRPETMEPMSALERKIVHNTVATFKDLETASQGEEPQRSVVIRRRR